jgi:hypothetical protein
VSILYGSRVSTLSEPKKRGKGVEKETAHTLVHKLIDRQKDIFWRLHLFSISEVTYTDWLISCAVKPSGTFVKPCSKPN